jgi:hypothetical protein
MTRAILLDTARLMGWGEQRKQVIGVADAGSA